MKPLDLSRRDFLATAAATSFAAGSPVVGAIPTKAERLVGIQIGPETLFDEGINQCLDRLQQKAAINAIFIYSQTYHMGSIPQNILATDHGVPVRTYSQSTLPRLWVRHRTNAFNGQVVQHQTVTQEHEYGDRDLFDEIREPTRARGIKLYARILEAGMNRQSIPGYQQVATVDLEGQPGDGPCWNNPDYRRWLYTTIRELVTNYELDGLQYGAERTGPLSDLLYRGSTPACFCKHCLLRNAERGVNVDRAKDGFRHLLSLVRDAEAGRSSHADGMLTLVMRTFYHYPEVLQWDRSWFESDQEIGAEIHRVAKSIRPQIDSGRHVDHQRSSWDFFYRSAISYTETAKHADFIKPIVYHDAMGPRLRWWVLERLKSRLLSELTLKESLQLFYALFDHDAQKQPQLDELDTTGLGPEYVYRETLRCKQAVGDGARVYAGIGIDVP